MAFTGGPFARGLESKSDEDIAKRLCEILSTITRREVPEPTGMVRGRWAGDPFAGGSYAFDAVGARGDEAIVLARPLGERVFFAGEATHPVHMGLVHGALLSGRREARRILRLA
jgi:monoamine oxidase